MYMEYMPILRYSFSSFVTPPSLHFILISFPSLFWQLISHHLLISFGFYFSILLLVLMLIFVKNQKRYNLNLKLLLKRTMNFKFSFFLETKLYYLFSLKHFQHQNEPFFERHVHDLLNYCML